MPHTNNKQRKSQSQHKQNNKKQNKYQQLHQDIEKIQLQLKNETPKNGDYLYSYKLPQIKQLQNSITQDEFRKKYKINFEDLPISRISKQGLYKRKFVKMTEIQRCTIPHALANRDILAASKTGSGKTLSYLIPVVEKLYLQKWSYLDGLGGLILLPTRELAMQVFDVLNSFSMDHNITVGLLIGGKNVEYEKKHIDRMNILVCTPGRLLQHLEETYNFDLINVNIFVLDEADLLLEMGFLQSIKQIVSQLPKQCQSMLFSATLSKKIHELAHLSLKEPEHIFLHDIQAAQQLKEGETTLSQVYETPVKLQQYYMVMNNDQKINNLFGFLKSHMKCKILVFVSTCKQVRYLYEALKKFKIGMPLLEIHGRMKQQKRMAMFYNFAEKIFGCMFTTNLAARGLDFPKVDWVVQLDCPENTQNYVHRIGRTARYKNDGKSIIFINDQEKPIIEKLQNQAKMKIHKIQQNPKKALTITNSLQAYNSEEIELKYLAQRAFISYVKFVNQCSDKKVFDISKINLNNLAASYGLVQTPHVEFIQSEVSKKSKIEKMREKSKLKKQQQQNQIQEEFENENLSENEENLSSINQEDEQQFNQTEQIKFNDDNYDEDIFVKKRDAEDVLKDVKSLPMQVSKRQMNKVKDEGVLKGKNITKIVDGKKYSIDEYRQHLLNKQEKPDVEQIEDLNIQMQARLDQNRTFDKKIKKEQLQQKKIKKKQKQQESINNNTNNDNFAQLGDQSEEESVEKSE